MEIKDPNILKWMPLAKGYSKELKISRPFHVALGEAIDATREFEFYWEPDLDPDTHQVRRPGLASMNTPNNERLPASSGTDLRSIHDAAQAANGQYLYSAGAPAEPSVMERGRFLLREIMGALHEQFNDGKLDENDAALAAVDAQHADDPISADAVAGALYDYAGLAKPFAEAMDGMGGFKKEYIDEATVTAEALREKPTQPSPKSADAAEWIALRNQLTNLLLERTAKINSAGKYVFRDRPDIARKFASAYERKRRAEARRRAAQKKKEEDEKNKGGG